MPFPFARDSHLLFLTGAFLAVNFLSLGLQRTSATDPLHWNHLLVWAFCAAGAWRWLKRRMPQCDSLLFPLVMLPAGWGLLLIDRLIPEFADRQTLWLFAGLVVALAVSSWPPLLQKLRDSERSLTLLLAILLVAATVLEGENAGLPGELLKLGLIVHFCAWLSRCPPGVDVLQWIGERRWQALLWLVPLLVLVWQRDPGTALLTGIVFVFLFVVAVGFRRILLPVLLLTVASALLAWLFLDVARQRIAIWIDPWTDAAGSGYQLIQGMLTIAEGGLPGAGVGQGTPLLVPVAHSDFVLAALAGEWGLLGVLTLLACMATLCARGLGIAYRLRKSRFHGLLAAGMTLLLAVQGLTISAGVLRLLPLTGVTLPFLGYGGSALLTSLLAATMLIRLSHEAGSANA